MKFSDVPIREWFRLEKGGRSYQKTSYSGYFLDRVMGEMQVNPEMQVFPIDEQGETPVAPI